MLRALLLGLLTVFATASCSKKSDAPAVAVGAAAGKVVELTGKVTATREGKPRELAVGAEVFRDDVIETTADATVTIELFHNGARWSVVSNKQARVDTSLAWGLDKQEAAKAVEHNSAPAGRNAERSAADTASTTETKEPPKPGAAAPMTEAAPAPAAPVAPPPAAAPAPIGGAADTKAAPPPPPPPPPPAPVRAKKESKGGDGLSAPRDVTPQLDAAEERTDAETSAPRERAGIVISPQTLAEKQRPALQKCLDQASPRPSDVTLVIDVKKGKTTTTVKGTNVTPTVRACMDAIVQKIEWPIPGATNQLTLRF